jgi:fused signal recognition particle receptor
MIKSVVSRLRKGLSRSRESFVSGLRGALLGRRLDDEVFSDLEARLIQADVGVKTTRTLVEGARQAAKEDRIKTGEELLEHLKEDLKRLWPEGDRSLHLRPKGEGPTVILVTGVNGVGKTTTIAKLAARLQGEGYSVLLGACDTFRAGAVRQLEIWADRLGVELVKGQQGGDPAAVAFDAADAAVRRGVDVLIIDTAGRLHTQDPLMRQLTKIGAVVGKKIEGAPHEALLVLDATSGQNAIRQAEVFKEAIPLTGLVLSKLDGTAKGGVVIGVRAESELPVKFIGIGERPEDLEAFDPEAFVEAMFGED